MRTSRKHFADRKTLSKRVIKQAVQTMEALESRTLFAATLVPTVIEGAPSPSTYTQGSGSGVTLTATVLSNDPGFSPTGMVTFMVGSTVIGTPQTLVGGSVVLSDVTTLPVGMDSVTADYGGDSNFVPTNSSPQTVTVSGSGTTTVGTSTALSASPSGSVPTGTNVTFTAVVTPSSSGATPTGTVAFFNGSSMLGTGTLDGTGTTTFSTSALPVGPQTITATYGGDSTYSSSNSNSVVETIDSSSGTTPSTVTVATPGPSTVTAGTSVTFNATVSPTGATGTVQFFSGSSSLGTSNVDATTGIATLTTSSLPVGGDSITAVYSGDNTFSGNTSSPITETVNPGALTPTTTAITTTTPTITAGSPVTFTATVAPSGATGTVQFFSGGSSIGSGNVSGGVATATTSALSVGSDTITATYSGDSNFAGSTSSNFTETVNPGVASTTTTVTANPAMTFAVGTNVMLTANVSPSTATGTVQFFDGSTALGAPVTLVNGAASINTAALAVGSNAITATYSGDINDTGSTSMPVTITGTIGTATLTTSSSAPTIPLGSSVTFTATVAPTTTGGPVPTGTVTFFDGMTAISGTVTLANGVATFADPSLTVGSHSISFSYSGDTNYGMGTSPAIIETVAQGSTVTTLMVSPNPILFGDSVTLTATISPSAATGTVTFFDGTTQLAPPVAVNSGVATLSVTSLPTGTDGLTAVYSGDSNYTTSTSTSVNETVNTAPSTTVLTTDINQVVFGNPVQLTANVPVTDATGTVAFYSDGILIGNSPLNGGVANLSASALPVGTDNLTAVYGGDSNYDASTSNAVPVTVSQGLTTTTLVANPTVIASGAPVTFTVTVAPVAGVPTPTGTVTLTEDGTVLAAGLTLVNGSLTYTSTTLTFGTDTIIATYSGDSTYLTSTSATATVAVTAVSTTTTTTTLTSTLTSPNYGDAVTFTAVVAPALTNALTPTGTLTFFDGTVPLGAPVALSGGVAFLTTTSLPPGVNSITAVYNGDSNFTPSTSAPVNENVIGTAISGVYVTTLDVSTFNAAFGAPVTLTASVFPTLAGTPAPFGGTVTFFSGGQTIGAATLGAGGTAVFSTALPAGTDEITAAYNGGGPVTASLPRMVAISSPATPSLAKANLPPAIVVGTEFHTNLPISLTNLGIAQLKGLFTIQVYLDTSTTLDANRDLLTTISKSFTLNGKKSRVFHAPETLSPTLPAGTYYYLVDVTDPNGLTNIIASKPIVIAAPFVALSASVSATNPPNIAVGQSADLFVTVTNTGNEAVVSGSLNLTLSASSDGVSIIAGKILGTGSITTTIQPGKSRKYRLVLDTTALANGSYFPAVSVDLNGVDTSAIGITPFTVG